MKRLQRECLTLSTVLHGVLLAIAFLGTAFLAKPEPPELTEPVTLLEFVPDKLVDENIANPGGAAPVPPVDPPPRQPEPEPEPEPQPEPKPDPVPEPTPPPKEPVKEPVRETRPAPPPREPVREPEPEPEKPKWTPSKEIKVNLNKITKTPTAAQQAAEKARAQRQREAREALNSSLNRLQSQFDTQISFSVPGSGGASYANYGAYVRTIYARNWHEPASGVQGNPIAKARIVIARDGRVLSSEIIESSGQPAMDRSVREVLDRIKNIGRPFPDGAKDDRRSFILAFDLSVKLGLG
jgi:outer membrane biosynthesis protein TonB